MHKDSPIPFNAFACEGNSEMSDEEVDAHAAQRFSKEKLQHQGRSRDKRSNSQFRSAREQLLTHMDNSNSP